ncbi:amino acid transporter [Streptomyces griseocarneus]|nr:amino acid transporter [Streptomyces griseocarneus]
MTRIPAASSAPPRDDGAPGQAPGDKDLSHGLKQRHLSMIALGGVIGAGLFVGSGAGIAAAGPGIVLAYAASGLLVMLVMRMLGEMAAANPASGTFSVHAERSLGPWAGFTVGWMFWVELCVGIAVEAIGAAHIMVSWFPSTPSWMWVLIFMAVFCGTNLAAVSNFGEFEFWFAALKVGAIGLFLVLGLLAILGVLPGTSAPGSDNLTGHGGFLPSGTDGLAAGLLASVFAYGGLETVTIAAAESEQPVRGVAKAVRTAMWRIALFYVGSMLVVVTLIPWDDKSITESGPYVAVLNHLDIPAAGQIMNVIVLIALLSAMNANIYGASRMSYSLVQRGEGPRFLGKVSGGVPRLTVLASSAFGFFAVLLSYWWPDTVFKWLLYMTGAAVLVVWGFIAVTQLKMRRTLEREAPDRLVVRMWWFPYITVVALVGILATLALMLREQDTRVQLYSTAGLTLALAAVGYARQRVVAKRKRLIPAQADESAGS